MIDSRARRLRIASILLAVLLLSAIVFASEAQSESIAWEQACPIGWSLFRAAPPADAVYRSEPAALHMTIRWRVGYAISATGGNWSGRVNEVTVTNTMEPGLSWVVSSKAFDSVLEHEQTHFDLNEVYRRKLDCLLQTIQCNGSSQQAVLDSLNARIREIASALLSKVSEMHALYDEETNGGQDPAMQAQWNEQVRDWLETPTAAP